jgi:catalase-peroxidase
VVANGASAGARPAKLGDNRRTIPVIAALRSQRHNGNQAGGVGVSLADLIVLAAARRSRRPRPRRALPSPFTPGRRDTTQALTDIEMATWLKPVVDGSQLCRRGQIAPDVSPEDMFLDRRSCWASPRWNGWCWSVAGA